MTIQFGQKLRKFRLRSRKCMEDTKKSLTQLAFVKELSEVVGLIYSHGAVSNWERGENKINHEDRTLLVGIIKVLFKCGGLTSVEEANQLLATGRYSSLTNQEIESINPEWLSGDGRDVSLTILPTIAEQLASLPIISDLIGMEATIADVAHRLANAMPTVHVALTGRKGVGKSAVANAVARRFVKTSTFTQLVWLPIVGGVDLSGSLAMRLGEKLGLAGMGSLSAEIQFYQLNVALQQTRCLVIIDGVATEEQLNAVTEFIAQLPPPTRVLLTTRITPSASSSVKYDLVTLPELSREATQALLQQLNPALESTHCTAIYDRIGGHPEALIFLARLLVDWPVKEVLSAFEHLFSDDIEILFNNIYAAIWDSLSAETHHLLRLLCFVSVNGVSKEMLQVTSGYSDRQLWNAVQEARRYGILHAHGSLDTLWYSLHQLTRHYIYAKSQSLEEEALAVIAYWQRRFDALDSAEWHLLDRERHNIFQAVRLTLRVADDHPSLQKALYHLAMTLYNFVDQRGFISDYLPFQYALVSADWLTDAQRALRYSQLGTLLRQQQKLESALQAHQQANDLAQTLQDPALLGRTQYNLAIDYRQLHKYAHALELVTQAQSAFTQSGETNLLIATINLHATIDLYLGNLEHARQQLEQAQSLAKTHSAPQSIQARILINLGQVLQRQKRMQDAQRALIQAENFVIGKNTSLHYTLWLAQSAWHLANEDPEKALIVLQQFDLEYLEQMGDLQRVALVQHNLGNAYYLQEFYGKAETSLRQAVKQWQLLRNKSRLARTYKLLGDVFEANNNPDAAHKQWEIAYDLAREYPDNARLQEIMLELQVKLGK